MSKGIVQGTALEGLYELHKALEDTTTSLTHGLYIQGKVEVRHADGFRVGWFETVSDWWNFVPDLGGGDE